MKVVQMVEEGLRREMTRGRGGSTVFPFPVSLEPPYSPFSHHVERPRSKETMGRLPPVQRIQPPLMSDLAFLRILLSRRDEYSPDIGEQLLLSMAARTPMSFEVVMHRGYLRLQIVCSREDAASAASQILALYPGAQTREAEDLLLETKGATLVTKNYRLRDSHLLQIRSDGKVEPYIALAGVAESIGEGDLALVQILLRPVKHPWHENIIRLASDPWDPSRSSFADMPNLPKKAKAKVERLLFALALRIAATDRGALLRIERSFLSQFESEENGLMSAGDQYPSQAVTGRFTQTPGMLLNARELASLTHFPAPESLPEGAVECARLTAKAPPLAASPLVLLGVNRHRGEETTVGLDAQWMARHVFIEGFTGSGKTTLLKGMLASLIERGYGLAFLDYAGDAAEELLSLVPENRMDDVIYFNAGDRDFPPALNVLQSVRREQEMLASEIMVALKRLFRGRSELGPRMEWILRQSIRALLDSRGEKTLRDLSRFLSEASYRKKVADGLDDPDLISFWKTRMDLSRAMTDPLLNRLSTFLDRPTVRNIVAKPGLIDLDEAVNGSRIIVFNLSKGVLGEEVSQVLGSLILGKLQLAAMARANLPASERKLFTVAIDEFQNVASADHETASVRSLLSEARKYAVALVVATQFTSQMDREVRAAVFGNVGTLVCLRCGMEDAKLLHKELGSFAADDLMNLDTGQAIVRMGRATDAFNVDISPSQTSSSNSQRDRIVRLSRERYCRPVSKVEDLLRSRAEDSKQVKAGPWPVDPLGNVYITEEPDLLQETAAMDPLAPGRDVSRKPSQRPETGGPNVDKELLDYLEHLANRPFAPALQRDEALGLSRYKGEVLRSRLVESGLARAHRVSTGKRSGQLTLLEVTETGYNLLASMKIKWTRPRGRGGFTHRYYAHKIKQHAEVTWPGCAASIEDGSRGRPVDVAVTVPAGSEHHKELSIAFEVYITGEAKELRGIARDVDLFDHVVVCSPDPGLLESLKARATKALGNEMLSKVTFGPVSRYLVSQESGVAASLAYPKESQRSLPKSRPKEQKREFWNLVLIPELDKSGAESEPEMEQVKATAGRKRGRKPKIPLLQHVHEAYMHLHDLDWLDDVGLVDMEAVQERVNPRHPMPEAQALRELLVEAAQEVMKHMDSVPGYAPMKTFLNGHLRGKSVSEIAQELGVTREWCSRRYRKEALKLASMQFVRIVSAENRSGC